MVCMTDTSWRANLALVVLKSALSGLNIALWDIKRKKLGVPAWQLLGRKVRDRVRVSRWVGGDSPSEIVSAVIVRREQGFTAVKINGSGLSVICLLIHTGVD